MSAVSGASSIAPPPVYLDQREQDCPICLQPPTILSVLSKGGWQVREDTALVGLCGHAIHKGCYEPELKNCPFCRQVNWIKGHANWPKSSIEFQLHLICSLFFTTLIFTTAIINSKSGI